VEAVGCMYVGSNPALCTSYLTMPFIMKFFKYNKQLNIIDIENSNIIYVNGILTSKKIALLQKRKLERLFKKTVAIIHNPTIGFFKDIFECVSYSTINRKSVVIFSVAEIIKNKINNTNKEIKLIGHSNGATIINHALKLIEDDLTIEQLKRIHFIAMGSPFIYDNLSTHINIEYFCNSHDPVTHFNKLKLNSKKHIIVHIRTSNGHFFVRDYLVPIKNGEFGNKNFFN